MGYVSVAIVTKARGRAWAGWMVVTLSLCVKKPFFFWFCTKFVCMLNKSNLILGTPVARLPYEEKSQKKKKNSSISRESGGEIPFFSIPSSIPCRLPKFRITGLESG